MTDPESSADTGADDIIGAFLVELEGAEDRSEVIGRYCRLHPECAGEIRGLLAIGEILSFSAAAPDSSEPRELGDFRIVRRIAQGGMGVVYEAIQDPLGRRVAVKVIREDRLRDDPGLRARFVREREVLARLHHSRIVPIYAAGQVGEFHFFAMPFIDGANLRRLIARAADLSKSPGIASMPTLAELARMVAMEDEPASAIADGRRNRRMRWSAYFRSVAEAMAQAAEAVQYAHESDVLHRDIKPANLMVDRHGHVWVFDFGLASYQADRTVPADPEDSATSGKLGTPAYMAPEQFEGRADAKSDVWALGAVLLELLTLKRRSRSADRSADEQADRSAIPPDLAAICRKAMRHEPDDRYPTALAFAEELRRWLRHEPVHARPAGAWRRTRLWARRNPGGAGLVATGLAVVVLGIGIAIQRLEVGRLRAEAESVRIRGELAQAEIREQLLNRALQLLDVPKLRGPGRESGWFDRVWKLLGSLRGDGRDDNPNLQGQASASLEGFDARLVSGLDGDFGPMAFDRDAGRLLMIREGRDEPDKPRYRTILWDWASGQIPVERDLGSGDVAYRSDGRPIQASLDADEPGWIRLFDVESGEELRDFRSTATPLERVVLSRKGNRLAALSRASGPDESGADFDTTIVVWDSDEAEPIASVRHKATRGVQLSPDGRLLAAWDDGGKISVWSMPNGELVARFQVGRARVTCLAFGRDPTWYDDGGPSAWLIAVGESTGLVTIWDPRAGRPRSVCRGALYESRSLDFSDDGALLLTAGRRPFKLWDVATGSCLLDIVADHCNSVRLSADGRRFAFSFQAPSSQESGVRILELDSGRGIRALRGLQGSIEKVAFSPDGKLVAAASHEWQIGLWERESGRLLGVLPAAVGQYIDNIGMAFDDDGQRFACSGGRRAQLWDVARGRTIHPWDLNPGLCDSLAFVGKDHLRLVRREYRDRPDAPYELRSPDEMRKAVRLYDLLADRPTRSVAEILDFDAYVYAIALAPDGSVFAIDGDASGPSGAVRRFAVHDATTGRLIREFPTAVPPGPGVFCSIAADSKTLAATLGGPGVGMSRIALPGAELLGPMPSVATTLGTGLLMARRSEPSNPMVIEDLDTGHRILTIPDDIGGSSTHCQFSRDGLYAAYGRYDGSVVLIDLVETNRRLTELRLGW